MVAIAKEEAIFQAAIEFGDSIERAAFLSQACAGDDALHGSVAELLALYDFPGDFLATPILRIGTKELEEGAGATVGYYRLIERIGEGGFGVVYRADQQQPVHRAVAVKIIKLGMDTEQIIRRFEAERQALALMSHSNIATVLDAGTTASGRPYFVMELVDGPPVDVYCDSHRLSVPERIRLLLAVCRAVEHAHQKGIVHRDLKPSNVLVVSDGGRPVPKVIDFGIAKALHQPASASLTGDMPSLLGTPEYMSPEQIGGGSDVDTRADIYSLGGLLYKLLTGSSPLELSERTAHGFDEICRMIREVDPIRPSIRLGRTLSGLELIAANRSTPPRTLRRMLRDDLDWIAAKALEKDRSRRYETVRELALDLERYLDNEPVAAGPPSRWYVTSKFVRRNGVAVTSAGLVVTALAIGGVMAAMGFVDANRERLHAEQEWQRAEGERVRTEQARVEAEQHRQQADLARESADLERQNAVSAAAKAQQTAQLLEQLLGASHPERGYPADYTVRQMLDEFAQSLGSQLEQQPDAEAAIRRTIGRSYLGIGQLARAGPHLERALNLRRKLFGEDHVRTAQSRVDYAVYLMIGSQLAEAQRAALLAIETLEGLGPTTELAWAYNVLATVHTEYGDKEESLRLRQKTWSLSEQARGRDHRDTILFQSRAAVSLASAGEGDRADWLARDAAERMRALRSAEHVDVAMVDCLLACVLIKRGQFEECEQLLRQVIDKHRKALGRDSYNEALDVALLAELLLMTRRRDEAEAAAREAVRIAERASIGETILLSKAYQTLAVVLQPKKPAESAEIWAKAIELRRQVIGERPEVAHMLNHYANVLQLLGRIDEAADCLHQALQICRDRPEQRVALSGAYLRLAEVLNEAGRREDAEETLRQSSEAFSGAADLPINRFVLIEALIDVGATALAESEADNLKRLADGDTRTITDAMDLTARARLLVERGDYATAEGQLRDAIALLRWPEFPRARFRAELVLAKCLIQSDRLNRAEKLLLTLDRHRRRQHFRAEDIRRLLKSLVELYSALNKPEEVARWQAELVDFQDD